jgi:hypothetical protein
MDAATMRSDVSGEAHEPNGAVVGLVKRDLRVNRTPLGRLWSHRHAPHNKEHIGSCAENTPASGWENPATPTDGLTRPFVPTPGSGSAALRPRRPPRGERSKPQLF